MKFLKAPLLAIALPVAAFGLGDWDLSELNLKDKLDFDLGGMDLEKLKFGSVGEFDLLGSKLNPQKKRKREECRPKDCPVPAPVSSCTSKVNSNGNLESFTIEGPDCDFSPLDNVCFAERVTITGCVGLTALPKLSLQVVEEMVAVTDNPDLADISGLSQLRTVGGDGQSDGNGQSGLSVTNNTSLQEIWGMDLCNLIEAPLDIEENPALEALELPCLELAEDTDLDDNALVVLNLPFMKTGRSNFNLRNNPIVAVNMPRVASIEGNVNINGEDATPPSGALERQASRIASLKAETAKRLEEKKALKKKGGSSFEEFCGRAPESAAVFGNMNIDQGNLLLESVSLGCLGTVTGNLNLGNLSDGGNSVMTGEFLDLTGIVTAAQNLRVETNPVLATLETFSNLQFVGVNTTICQNPELLESSVPSNIEEATQGSFFFGDVCPPRDD
uniref:Uncharacterized protein n=1 Tax=Chromera velia CCMP2878 TaxID=1169474 RepID=A0A0G4I9B5_9ALVE|mmetsp:Transcript_55349/g.108340  ORF Transcript_55349/g.108340 Transcript_55349/m.108340 type:complete len:445 (+) Transcript_55349:143-1477(+)|eukprot:Cvel_12202.t1-p1 / transcript=Cvel_12202.t1 / gene=Cvel_12202 / organism=Chromera_velia_CCMP2878 / gene_product=hypothetical protein / transcript_product=hypothetical protein / location=Cvel_scaffold789:6648-9941(+) / protein_length=444 / sequence_SO=supercontig / SO=protein_coding / is_pseudo=false